MDRQRIWITLVGGFLLLIAGGSIAWAVVHPADVKPARLPPGQAIDNSYFPLAVGTLFVYIGTKEGVPTYDEICVTPRTKLIEGVQITVVHHRSFAGSSLDLVEDTEDWFAQDVFGNVWYFGENTIELPSGSTEGSWQAGVNDADAGFIMLADPQVGDRYYQKFARHVAKGPPQVARLNETGAGQGSTY